MKEPIAFQCNRCGHRHDLHSHPGKCYKCRAPEFTAIYEEPMKPDRRKKDEKADPQMTLFGD